jgi:hypothetical protein
MCILLCTICFVAGLIAGAFAWDWLYEHVYFDDTEPFGPDQWGT